VQVFFQGGRRRDYLILYRTAGYCRKGGWWVRSLAKVATPGELDLRKRQDAERLAATLGVIDPASLAE
jgi:hypothetical protein